MKIFPAPLKKIGSDRRFLAALALTLALFLCAAIYAYVTHRSIRQFSDEYAQYAALAQVQEDAAYLPAAPNNPIRQQLNLVLVEVLDASLSSPKRLQDAQQGLQLARQLDAEVDAIGDSSDKANAAVAKMQVDSLSDFSSVAVTGEILGLAKQRSSIIEDIRGLSYRADFETENIFERIIADKGALTEAYVSELNGDIPDVETEFDQRTALYDQLQSVSAQIDQKAGELNPEFSPPTPDQ